RIAGSAGAAKEGSSQTAKRIARCCQAEGPVEEEAGGNAEFKTQAEIVRGTGSEPVDSPAGAAGFKSDVPGGRGRRADGRQPEYYTRESLRRLCGPDAALDFAEMANLRNRWPCSIGPSGDCHL